MLLKFVSLQGTTLISNFNTLFWTILYMEKILFYSIHLSLTVLSQHFKSVTQFPSWTANISENKERVKVAFQHKFLALYYIRQDPQEHNFPSNSRL